ncbi:MAG: rod shape-determining protein MreC [Pseudomonadales bacterium]|nr:rod shape-determining protein MreC [Pseudomonadales bacterium]NIX06878.1 rod shape-determining protein MreC [Pseudomonadales bacterium]
MKALFVRESGAGFLLTGLVLVSLILVTLDLTTSLMRGTRQVFGTLLAPLHYVAETPYLLGDELGDVFATRAALLEENQLLERQVLELSKISLQYRNLLKENENLRELLGSRARLPDEVLIAEIIGVVPTVGAHQVLIDKGADAGVQIGQAVIDSEGLFGQVVEVDVYSSRVLLITDRDHAVPVQINRNGVRSIAGGTGRMDQLELENVPITADVVKGDLVETSGLGGRFPEGYPVGEVESVVVYPAASLAQVLVRPSAQLDRSRHVLVVFAPETREEVLP